ncbi:unnamed protein product [Hymenolepis diminuta]|uniref:E3 ubiquitin-protein ligase E3D n=1 Tax=Hymenolepis diminuta TaxID=6216 RepID=A0A0R3SFP8_HYMDI|nr:unnamed protein product [Hymenolepis diminuta]
MNSILEVSTPNIIHFSDGFASYAVSFPDLTFKPDTANVLSTATSNSESISFLASYPFSKPPEDKRFGKICDRIVRSDMIRCKFCDAVFANSKKINKVEFLRFVDSLAVSEISTYFCHGESQSSVVLPSPLSIILSDLPDTSVLSNGVELIVGSDALIDGSLIQSKELESVFCSRCRIMVGRLVGDEKDRVMVFYTNSLKIRRPDRDAEGNFLRVVDIPLVKHDFDFFDLLFHHLMKANRYRILLSAGTHDSALDYTLIWILCQRTCLYNTIVNTSKFSLTLSGDEPEASETVSAEKMHILKVAYRRLPRGQSNAEKDAKLVEWTRDFTVNHLRLPMETCISLMTCLEHVTRRLAPFMRSGTKAMEGFTVGCAI